MKVRFLVWLGLVPLLAASRSGGSAAQSIVNKLPVESIEMGVRIGQDSLRVRFHASSGQAFDQDLAPGAESQALLEMSRLLATGGARMFVEVQNGEVVGFQAAVP